MNVLELPAHDISRLIKDPTDLRIADAFRCTDATTALTRGIAEYVAGMSIVMPSGRQLQFASSYDAWAVPENLACYPGFIAYTNDAEGEYDEANNNPQVSNFRYADGSYEVSAVEMTIDIKCEIWANDPEDRQSLMLMLEEGFQPVDWMYGFRLELPHYFHQRATFSPTKNVYMGASQEALAGFYNARMTVRASVPVTRVLSFPQANPQVIVNAGTSDVIPPPGVVVRR